MLSSLTAVDQPEHWYHLLWEFSFFSSLYWVVHNKWFSVQRLYGKNKLLG